MERYDITIQMYSADASGTQYVWEKVPAEEGDFVLYADAQATIAALQARVNELESVLSGDLELTKLHYEPGQPLEFQAKHPLIAIMAASMARMCDDLQAENYVEVQFNHHEKGHFILTVQKMFHPTPHQLRQKAESQLTQRTAELEAAKADKAKWEDIAGLRFAGDHKFVKEMELLKVENANLQAELERVMGLIVEYAKAKTDFDEKRLQEDHYAGKERYNRLVEAENALLQHRQGMEG